MKKQGHHRIMGQKIRRSPQLPLCGVAHVLPAAEESIAQGVDFVRQSPQAWRLPSKTIAVTLLTVEGLLAQLLRTSQEHADIIIKLYRAFGAVDTGLMNHRMYGI